MQKNVRCKSRQLGMIFIYRPETLCLYVQGIHITIDGQYVLVKGEVFLMLADMLAPIPLEDLKLVWNSLHENVVVAWQQLRLWL